MHGLSAVRWAQVLLILVACAGCASFSEGRLPQRNLADFERDRLAAVTYEFMEGNAMGGGENLVVMTTTPAAFPSILQSRVEPIFRRAFVESTHQKEPGEWHVDMYYRETERNPAITYTLALFFIVSLGLVPAYSQTDLYLEAKLRHDGETVKQYIYEESTSTWVHWFVLPWSFSHDPMERKSALIDNLVLNLIHDLGADLPHGARAAGG